MTAEPSSTGQNFWKEGGQSFRNPHALFPGLQKRVFAYLQETAAVAAAPADELWRGRGGARWKIQKLHAERTGLEPTMSLGGAKWEVQVREELHELVSASLANKLAKTRGVHEDVIVLLVDAYHCVDSEAWLGVARALNISRFHAVARVYLDHECQILSTVEPAWAAIGFSD